MRREKLLSFIIPCYNEEGNIQVLYHRLLESMKGLPYDLEIFFIDNDSTDNSFQVLKNLAKKDIRVKVLFMSRNFGTPQSSYIAGLTYAKGDAAVLLQGDIQDPPEIIPKFIQKWKHGFDVVYGVSEKRKGYGPFMNLVYKSFYFIMSKLSYIHIPPNAGEFSLIDRKVIKELLSFKEYEYHVRFLRAFVGFRQIGVPYVREARAQGKSTETFLTGLWWAKNIIINFSFKPLELISQLAFLVMIFTFILIVINLVLYFILGDSPRGIPTIVILILFLSGIQLLCLSVISEYLGKIFLEVKGRPRYIVKKTLNVKQKDENN